MNSPLHNAPPLLVPYTLLWQARDLMRAGADLKEAAAKLGVQARDLDLSLWRTFGEGL